VNWRKFFIPQLERVRPYEPGLREEQAQQVAVGKPIYKLSSNESPYPPFPVALGAMTECLTTLNRYSDGSAGALKASIAAKFNVKPEQIMVGNGANELLSLLAQSCLDEHSRVAYCSPSFVVYRLSAQIANAACDEVALDAQGGFDLEALASAVGSHTKIVYVCSPNNPSGGIVRQRQFTRFIHALPRSVLVVVDMAYADFVQDPDHADPLALFDGNRPLVILRSFSKIYGLAGLRIGFGIAPEPVVQAVDKLREPFNVNTVAQVAALASLHDDSELARRRETNAGQRARLYKILDRVGLTYFHSEANFVWVHFDDPAWAFSELMKRGVIVRPFPAAGGLRIGVGSHEATLATIEALEALFCR
jgi:histidinol-phosphate aminotransferase